MSYFRYFMKNNTIEIHKLWAIKILFQKAGKIMINYQQFGSIKTSTKFLFEVSGGINNPILPK